MDNNDIKQFLIKHPNQKFDIIGLCAVLSCNRASITRRAKQLRLQDRDPKIKITITERRHFYYEYDPNG